MLNKEIIKVLTSSGVKFKVLRDSRTHKALGISYTEDGLKMLTNKTGRLLYYRNARLALNNNQTVIKGDTRKSDRVYVEDFNPREFNNEHLNVCEYLWTDKAIKMSK